MAERYDEQYRGDRGQRGDRGFMDRAGDEVRSWFGDDEAERRRQMDDPGRDREGYRDRQWGQSSEYGRGQEYRGQDYRGQRYGRDVSEYGSRYGSNYDRSGSNYDMGPRGSNYSYSYGSYGPGSSQGFQGYGQGTGRSWSYGQGERDYGWSTGRSGAASEGSRYRGDFAGRGPKGYQRSDARINEDVCDRLCDAPDIDATNIEVKVQNGEVTLSGSVSDRSDKRRAEDLIENVSGVREVHNNLRVGREQENQGLTGTASTGTANVSGTNQDPGTPGSTLGLTGTPDKTSTAGGRRWFPDRVTTPGAVRAWRVAAPACYRRLVPGSLEGHRGACSAPGARIPAPSRAASSGRAPSPSPRS
jgi:osmotically-inducible protein OsmY